MQTLILLVAVWHKPQLQDVVKEEYIEEEEEEDEEEEERREEVEIGVVIVEG